MAVDTADVVVHNAVWKFLCRWSICTACVLWQLNPGLAFSLIPTENFNMEPVNFVATSEEIFNIWTDGINALLGKPVSKCRTVCYFNHKYAVNYFLLLVYVTATNLIWLVIYHTVCDQSDCGDQPLCILHRWRNLAIYTEKNFSNCIK